MSERGPESGDLDLLLRDAPTYRATGAVTATRLEEAHRWRSGRGSDLSGAPGDWLVSDGSSEWTVDATVFARTYRPRPDGRYAKHALVRAVRVETPVDVPSVEGTSRAEPGDWVLLGPEGELWPVADDHFRSHYEPVTRG